MDLNRKKDTESFTDVIHKKVKSTEEQKTVKDSWLQ